MKAEKLEHNKNKRIISKFRTRVGIIVYFSLLLLISLFIYIIVPPMMAELQIFGNNFAQPIFLGICQVVERLYFIGQDEIMAYLIIDSTQSFAMFMNPVEMNAILIFKKQDTETRRPQDADHRTESAVDGSWCAWKSARRTRNGS